MPRRRKQQSSSGALAGLVILVLVGLFVAVIESNPWVAFAFLLLVAVVIGLGVYLWLRRRRGRRVHVKNLGELMMLTPKQFEMAVVELLRSTGYRDVRHTGGAGDLAADIRCRDDKGRSVVVQCKRYAPGTSIGSRDMQTFIGVIAVHHKADRGIFVTTSDFTAPAIDLAKRHSITLIDGAELSRVLDRARSSVANAQSIT